MSIAACTEFGDSCIASAQPGASVQRGGGDCEYSVILGWSEIIISYEILCDASYMMYMYM